MNRLVKLGVLALFLSLSISYAFAADTVTSTNATWQLLPGSFSSTGGTWGLPANLTGIGCGSENETTCEPTGDFVFNAPITATPGYFTITDTDGPTGSLATSDTIVFANTGAGGNGEVLFYSDPNTAPALTGYTNDGVLCQEVTAAPTDPTEGGCSAPFKLTLTDGNVVTITPRQR